MFLVEVITGEFCKGNSKITVMPNKPITNEAYDCLVDDMASPTKFVTFKDSSAYPLYVLKY